MFYIEKSASQKYSVEELERSIALDDYHHQGNLPNNFIQTLPSAEQAFRTINTFKDEYLLDYINVEELGVRDRAYIDERVLENSIINNVKNFILTFGKSFAFVRNQYHLDAFGEDQYINLDYFNNGRFRLLALLKEKSGIGQVIMPAILAESNENMRRKTDTTSYPELLDDTGITADQLPKIWYAAGVHPTRVWGKHTASEGQWEKWIREAARRPDTVAIGETGLDYHYEMDEDMLARQHMWFEKQLQIAEEYSLPLILHIRMTSVNALEVLRRYALADGG